MIYCIRNIINNKLYIGQTIKAKIRWHDHVQALKGNKHQNSHLQKAYNKYGHDSFLFEIIDELLDNEDITQAEQDWIDLHKTLGYELYNMRPVCTSNRGIKHSSESKANMSAAAKNKIFTIEHRQKINEAQAKRKGYKQTPEQIAKRVAARLKTMYNTES